jgi:hypothetical protein
VEGAEEMKEIIENILSTLKNIDTCTGMLYKMISINSREIAKLKKQIGQPVTKNAPTAKEHKNEQ